MNNVINFCFYLSFIFQINKWSKLRIISFSKPVSSSKSRLIIGPLHVTPLLVMIIGGMKGQTMAPRIKKPFDSFLIWFNLRTGIVAAARWNESGGTPFFTGENPEEYHLNRLQLTLVRFMEFQRRIRVWLQLQVIHHDTPAGDGGLLPSNDDDLGRTFGTPRYGEVAASIIAWFESQPRSIFYNHE